MKNNKPIELLAPAGSLSKMKYALEFGADAVYLGVPDFSLRVRINKFNEKDFLDAVEFAHNRGKKVYVTLNIYAHNYHLEKIKKHLEFLRPLGIDAVIVSDPGIINLAKKHLPKVDIHLSTQANATNFEAVRFWRETGVKRIILAREVSLEEIKEIHRQVPDTELEVFIHGAMCMSYSGRCILSKWMSGRSANLGDCSQPCRWAYHKINKPENKAVEINLVDDQKRFGLDVEEDEQGTYFFNSFDLNLIEHMEKLVEAGVSSLKIEGRAKSAYYVAVVTRAYRQVLDAILEQKNQKTIKSIVAEQKTELENLVNRGYWTGFLLGDEPPHNFSGKILKSRYEFVGEVEGVENNLNLIKVHNALKSKDEIEAITPKKNVSIKIKKILNAEKEEVFEAHGGHIKKYYFELDKILPTGSLIRKKITGNEKTKLESGLKCGQ